MLEPIEYRILLHLQTALQAISIAGGYHYDVGGTAVKLDPNQDVETLIGPDGPRPFIVIEVKPERREYFPAFGVKVTLPLVVHHVNDASPDVDVDRMRTWRRACADVEQALTGDISRGGLAIDTRIITNTFNEVTDAAYVWSMVEIEIPLRRQYGLPNAA